MSSYNVNIFASFLQKALIDPQQELSDHQNISTYLNWVPTNQTATISAHPFNDITQLSITSNGIDEFNIFPVKFNNERINFVVKLKDSQGFDVKDYQLLDLANFQFSLSSLNGTYLSGVNTYSNFGTLSTLTQGGFFKGYIVSPGISNEVVCIKAVYTDVNLNLTGYSTPFTVNNVCDVYSLRKINENFNQTDAFKSLAYQPVMFDKEIFFNQFLGQIVGNNNSDPNTLGIEIYEKISNYVSNINDIEYCNVDALKALLDEIQANYQNFNYNYPPSLQRLVDILSVKHKLIFGQTNQYEGNFNDKGFIKSSKYGLNKGNLLPIETTVIDPNSGSPYLVTYEKFGQVYNTVNKVFSGAQTAVYPLSNINNSWGWNLVIPTGVSGLDVGRYYEFYEFVPHVEGSLLQQFLDFNNPNNTLSITNSSYNAYVKEGGIVDTILLQNLYTNLQIVTCFE